MDGSDFAYESENFCVALSSSQLPYHRLANRSIIEKRLGNFGSSNDCGIWDIFNVDYLLAGTGLDLMSSYLTESLNALVIHTINPSNLPI